MKLELTNPTAWSKLSEKKVSMQEKIKIYEKLGGAYRFAHNEDEQVFNKLTELLKYAINERKGLNEEMLKPGQAINVVRNGENLGKFSVRTSTNNEANIMSQTGMEEINLKYFNNEYVDIKGNKYEISPIATEVIYEGDDHEVSMAMGQLDDIIKNVTELKGKIGSQEIDLPGWVQDHISQSQNFINQANTGYHELKP
jgi:hypothetical protein